jgi:hypothetical protein
VPKLQKPHIPDLKRILTQFAKIANEVMEEEVEAFNELELARFVERIERQDFFSFRAIPLNSAYLAKKIAEGADPRVMIASAFYKDNIRIFRRKDGKHQTLYYIGFDKRTHARDLKGRRVPILLVDVAWVQEKGSLKANVPERPHWGPHFQDMHKRAEAVRVDIQTETIKRAKRKFPGFN